MKPNEIASGIWYSLLFATATVFAQYLTSISVLNTINNSHGMNSNNICIVAFFLLIGILISKLLIDTLAFMKFPPLSTIKSTTIFILSIYTVTATIGFFVFINKSAHTINLSESLEIYWPVSLVVLTAVLILAIIKVKRFN